MSTAKAVPTPMSERVSASPVSNLLMSSSPRTAPGCWRKFTLCVEAASSQLRGRYRPIYL